MKFFALLALLLLPVCYAGDAIAAVIASGPAVEKQTASGTVPLLCVQTTMNFCGLSFDMPSLPTGSIYTLTLPKRFVVDTANLQCVSNGKGTYYSLLNQDVNGCAIKTCKPAALTFCEHTFDITSSIPVGENMTLAVAPELVDVAHMATAPALTVACADSPDGGAYTLTSANGLTCNSFLCQPAELPVCDSSVAVTTAAPLGVRFDTATRDGQPVAIQCLGTLGQPPHYTIVDHACNVH